MKQTTSQQEEVILTGDRATGPLHLGHYVGSLKQRIQLQYMREQTVLVDDMQGSTDNAYVAELKQQYQQGSLGDGTCKKILEDCLQTLIAPFREKLAMYLNDKAQLINILRKGSEQADRKTQQVLFDVKEVFGLNLF